jgi:uncharacterized protein
MAGKLVHFEVPASDTSRALNFYGQMFGWKLENMPGPVEYHMGQIDDSMGGAIFPADQGSGGHGIFVYFDVDDINAGSAQVRDLGGKADDAQPVPQMGWFARCEDTEGNAFGLWQSDSAAPAPEGAQG